MKRTQGAVVFCNGLNQTQCLNMAHLGTTQEEADPVLQQIRLLLQAAIAGELPKELQVR